MQPTHIIIYGMGSHHASNCRNCAAGDDRFALILLLVTALLLLMCYIPAFLRWCKKMDRIRDNDLL